MSTIEQRRAHAGVSSGRLAAYLAIFQRANRAGKRVVTSVEVAEVSGVNATAVRRDLSEILGKTGTKGVGYDVSHSIMAITMVLGGEATGGALHLIAAEVGRMRVEVGDERVRAFDDGIPVVQQVRAAARIVLAIDALIAEGGG